MDGDDEHGPLGYPSNALSHAELHAQWAQLDAWVARLHAAFEDFWPPVPKGSIMEHQRARDLPWPPCWREHPGLVEDLVALKAWHEALTAADGRESVAKSWMEWTSTVQHLLVPRVQRLARYCQQGHRATAIAAAPALAEPAQAHLKGMSVSVSRRSSHPLPAPSAQHGTTRKRHHNHGLA